MCHGPSQHNLWQLTSTKVKSNVNLNRTELCFIMLHHLFPAAASYPNNIQLTCKDNKKFEVMLTRRAKAHSSSGSVV